MPPIPKNLTDTINELLTHGWTFAVQQTVDTGHHPFIRIQAYHEDGGEKIVTTWHTRDTNGQTYRWRSAHHGNAIVPTLAKLRDIIVEDDE